MHTNQIFIRLRQDQSQRKKVEIHGVSNCLVIGL